MNIEVKKIRYRRSLLGVTLQEISDGTDINISLLSRYENGKTIPRLCSLIKIDRYLKEIEGEQEAKCNFCGEVVESGRDYCSKEHYRSDRSDRV